MLISKKLFSLTIIPFLALYNSYSLAQTNDKPTPIQISSDKIQLKRKIIVKRFVNSTNFGKALLLGNEVDPRTVQATDILSSRLVETGNFVLLDSTLSENASKYADTLIVGSITELGRRAEGRQGFINSTMRQVGYARVEVRLIDAQSGQAYYTATGIGNATIETKETAGFGSGSTYDSALTDKAISAAIADLTNNLIAKLQSRKWSSSILQISDNEVFIAGGVSIGIKKGQILDIAEKGKVLENPETGAKISLPGNVVAQIEINNFFGDNEINEGSIGKIISGKLNGYTSDKLIVKEPIK